MDEGQQPDTNTENSALAATRPIEFGFHVRLAMKVGLLLAGGVLVPAGVFWMLTANLEGYTYGEALQTINEFRLALFRVTVLSAAGQVVLVGLLTAAVALFASHKIAGPLIRFERCVRELAEGNLSQTVGFRRGDQNKSLPGPFHDLCGRLRQRVATARAAANNLRELREHLEKRGTAEPLTEKEAAEIHSRLREQAKRLRQAGSFGVEADES